MAKVADTSEGEAEFGTCIDNYENKDDKNFKKTLQKVSDSVSQLEDIWEKKCNKSECSKANLKKLFKKAKQVKTNLEKLQKYLSTCEILNDIIAKITKAEQLC